MPVSVHSISPPSSPQPPKRQKLDHNEAGPSTSTLNYRDGVMLAPMVRSGTLPTRLLSLRYGASLVWSPETVDRAIIGCERVVDPSTGVINYMKANKSIWSTHPIEKPYLIFQIGSASPTLAVQAALTVLPDISGIDLNCGCPKPFSTSGGMGAALLSKPDLLCSILSALKEALPSHMPVTAKIRLLPDPEDTRNLVRRIVDTGIRNLTVHCRTRDMRPHEKALIERLRDVVKCVESTGKDVSVIENGDCLNVKDAERIRTLTGAHSVMLARAAEANPSCFLDSTLADAETLLIPDYIRLANYLGNAWGNSKFCLQQFSSPVPLLGKAKRKEFKQILSQAKDYTALETWCGEGGLSGGEKVLEEVKKVLSARTTSSIDLSYTVIHEDVYTAGTIAV